MAEVDFELARAEFGGDHRGIDALGSCRLDHFIEHRGEARQALDVHVRLIVGIAGQLITGKLRQAVLQAAVEQVKLQLEGHHRENAFAVQTVQHPRQHFTGFEFDGFFGAVGGDQHLAQGLLFPAHQLQRAGHQTAQRVRVTIVEAVIADLEQPTLGAEQHAVLRQLQCTAGSDFFQHLDRVALAVEMPRNVQGDQVDVAHFGVAVAEVANLGQQFRAHSIHRFVPCCYQV
ncbi:hypothetical protein D3C76_564360 [compost metagenome]